MCKNNANEVMVIYNWIEWRRELYSLTELIFFLQRRYNSQRSTIRRFSNIAIILVLQISCVNWLIIIKEPKMMNFKIKYLLLDFGNLKADNDLLFAI